MTGSSPGIGSAGRGEPGEELGVDGALSLPKRFRKYSTSAFSSSFAFPRGIPKERRKSMRFRQGRRVALRSTICPRNLRRPSSPSMNASRSRPGPPRHHHLVGALGHVEQVVHVAPGAHRGVEVHVVEAPGREDVFEGQAALAVVEARDRAVDALEELVGIGDARSSLGGRSRVRQGDRRVVGVAGDGIVPELGVGRAGGAVVHRRRVVVEVGRTPVEVVLEGPLDLAGHRPGTALARVGQQVGGAGQRGRPA